MICLYVFDEDSPGRRPLGGASRWWLAGSLRELNEQLRQKGAQLLCRRGRAVDVIFDVVRNCAVDHVYWNESYDPGEDRVSRQIAEALRSDGRQVSTFNASLLHEPGTVKNRAGEPFTVFTPFWRTLRAQPVRALLLAPEAISGHPELASDTNESWLLEPRHPDWASGLRETWTRGESGASQRLCAFIVDKLPAYATRRDRPDLQQTSRLSPHLRFGEIGPVQVWHAVEAALAGSEESAALAPQRDKLISEIGWREFSYSLLNQHPDLARRNLHARFDRFPWRSDARGLNAWQRGLTGYPIVDAGMRQLWQTGWMHNRVRMVAASFLIKHLLVDWREGEAWFWDTLVDADPANNPASWQWVAGSGADAAPYFRIFNPVLQGEKFDPEGGYVRRFVPELAGLPAELIHAPWRAPPLSLKEAGVSLGSTYPLPIVDHVHARRRALEAYAQIAGQTA